MLIFQLNSLEANITNRKADNGKKLNIKKYIITLKSFNHGGVLNKHRDLKNFLQILMKSFLRCNKNIQAKIIFKMKKHSKQFRL